MLDLVSCYSIVGCGIWLAGAARSDYGWLLSACCGTCSRPGVSRLLTIVGGVHDWSMVTCRERRKRWCARGASWALLGASTSPLNHMNVDALLDTLRRLEVETHQPHVRADHCKLGRLLHPNFFEVGRSGTLYCRDSVLAEFNDRPPSYKVW